MSERLLLDSGVSIDPRDDNTDLGHHEIWKGVTCDDGESFEWTPVTMCDEEVVGIVTRQQRQ